jgi:hypothetical protein
MHHGDLRARFLTEGRLIGVLIRMPDGSIVHRLDNEGTLHPAEVDAAAVRQDNDDHVHWWDQSLFDNLEQGWPHPAAHVGAPLLLLEPYSTSLYASYWNFEKAVAKSLDTEVFPSFMLPPSGIELPCLPYLLAGRAMVPKKGTDDMRQVVNHSQAQEVTGHRFATSTSSRLPPPAKGDPAIRPPQALSYNERILKVKPVGPQMEMSKGADIAHNAFVLISFGFEVVLITFDAKGYFHCFKVSNKRATEQGLITRNGLSVSCALDMGLTDAPENSGGMSDFISMAVGLALDLILRSHPLIANNKRACAYRREREALFGVGSMQTWWATVEMYSDDLTITTLMELEHLIADVVNDKGDLYGLQWHVEKYGRNAHIGYSYNFAAGLDGRQHIRREKLDHYADHCVAVANMKFATDQEVDQVLGQLNHAASVETGIKQHVGALNTARHMRTKLRKHLTPISATIARDLLAAAAIMRLDQGLPLLCEYRWPSAHALSTVSMRCDACLNEGWNGFGAWFIVPNPTGTISIYALFSEWTEEEQRALGHNTPGAEALGVLISARVFDREGWQLPHHTDLLALTDSETTASKFATVRLGSRLMDTVRDQWLRSAALRSISTVCDHLPREFNVGSDLLSKNCWHMFADTLKAAGLPPPTLVNIHPHDRDTAFALKSLG